MAKKRLRHSDHFRKSLHRVCFEWASLPDVWEAYDRGLYSVRGLRALTGVLALAIIGDNVRPRNALKLQSDAIDAIQIYALEWCRSGDAPEPLRSWGRKRLNLMNDHDALQRHEGLLYGVVRQMAKNFGVPWLTFDPFK